MTQITATRARRLQQTILGVLAVYLAMVLAGLAVLWVSPWGVASITSHQMDTLKFATCLHGAAMLLTSAFWSWSRRQSSCSVRRVRVTLLACIVVLPVSVDVLVGIAFPTIRAEGGHSLRHPKRGWTNAPNRVCQIAGATARLDSNGMRIDESPGGRACDGRPAALFVGDSLTFGWEVKYRESFPVRTAQRLRDQVGIDVCVLIGGTGGYDTIQELDWFLEVGLPLNPRLVVLQFCLNDIFCQTDREWLWEDRWSTDKGHAPAYLNWSGIGRAAWLLWRLPNPRTGLIDAGVAAERFGITECLLRPDSPRVVAAFVHVTKATEKFVEVCRANGIGLMWVLFPLRDQVIDPGLSTWPQQRIKSLAQQYGVACVDVLEAYRVHQPNPVTAANELMKDLTHPTVLGYDIAARQIAQALIQSGLVDTLRDK